MNKKAAAIVGGILVLGLGVFGFTKLNSGSQNQQTQQEQSAEQTTVPITDANGEKDKATQDFLWGFVREQVEEEATAAGIVDMIKKAGATGIFFVDVKLGER